MQLQAERTFAAYVALFAVFGLIMMEAAFYQYGKTADAVILKIEARHNRFNDYPEVEFTTPDGVKHRETLSADFFTADEEKPGDIVTVQYLDFYPDFVRPAGIEWVSALLGVILLGFGIAGLRPKRDF